MVGGGMQERKEETERLIKKLGRKRARKKGVL